MSTSDKKKYYIKAIIERFEGKFAVIKTDDKQKILWPIKNLPDDIREGSSIRLIFSTSKTEQEERTKVAKTMLNEILKGE